MNDFDRMHLKQQFLRSELVPTWASFRQCIDDLITSYNALDPGEPHCASVKENGDMALMIECKMGPGTGGDSFSSLIILIKAKLDRGKLAIQSVTEHWQTIASTRFLRESSSIQEFPLDGDPSSKSVWLYLTTDERRLDVQQVASLILRRALEV